jgi:hypothetical protein
VRHAAAVTALAIAVTSSVAAIGHSRPEPDDGHGPARADRLAPPARFDPLPAGWRQYGSGVVRLRGRGGESETFATSWDLDRANRHGPAGDLPRGGILVSVLLLRRCVAPGPDHPPLGSRLRLPRVAAGTLEGMPHVPEYRIFGARDRDYYADVRVDINARRPSARLRREAQHALSVLRLPHWPAHCM